MIKLNDERRKKSFSDLVIEKSVELYGFAPDDRSDENLKWMRENGYLIKQTQKHRRGTRGRRSKLEHF